MNRIYRDPICKHTVTSEVLGGCDFWGTLFDALQMACSDTLSFSFLYFRSQQLHKVFLDSSRSLLEGPGGSQSLLKGRGRVASGEMEFSTMQGFPQRTPLRKDSEEILGWTGDGRRWSGRVWLCESKDGTQATWHGAGQGAGTHQMFTAPPERPPQTSVFLLSMNAWNVWEQNKDSDELYIQRLSVEHLHSEPHYEIQSNTTICLLLLSW